MMDRWSTLGIGSVTPGCLKNLSGSLAGLFSADSWYGDNGDTDRRGAE